MPVGANPALGAVEHLWDPDWLGAALTASLWSDAGHGIDSVEVVRIRHRPGRRCIGHYRVSSTIRGRPEVHLVAAVAHPNDRGRRHARRLRRAHPPDADRTFTQTVAFLPRDRVLFLRFPIDPRLPGLADLSSSAGRSALAEAAGLNATTTTIEPVRHRLGLSATVRATSRASVKYLKFVPPGHAAEIVSTVRSLASATAMGGRFALALPVDGRDDLVTTHEAAGDAFDTLAARSQRDRAPAVANALADLHGGYAGDLPDRRSNPWRRAVRAGITLRHDLPDAQSSIDRLLATYAPPDSPPTPVHGDMKPDHLLLAGDVVSFVDLDSSGAGHPLSDLASLAVRLPAPAAEVLVQAYAEQRAIDPTAWAGHWALASLKHALHLAQRRTPDWTTKAKRAIVRGLDPV